VKPLVQMTASQVEVVTAYKPSSLLIYTFLISLVSVNFSLKFNEIEKNSYTRIFLIVRKNEYKISLQVSK
jgi:hypothetical protein